MTQITANVNPATRILSISMLTWDTLLHLAEIMLGNRFAALSFTEDEASTIEHLAYVANIGADSKTIAWNRFRDRCLSDTRAEVPETVKAALRREESEGRQTLYVVNEQWESEEFTYTEAEKDSMLTEIADWLYEDDVFRADYEEGHADDLHGLSPEEAADCFFDYCRFAAEDAVADAEVYGRTSIGCLNIRVTKEVAR